jgi:hypothetical protein
LWGNCNEHLISRQRKVTSPAEVLLASADGGTLSSLGLLLLPDSFVRRATGVTGTAECLTGVACVWMSDSVAGLARATSRVYVKACPDVTCQKLHQACSFISISLFPKYVLYRLAGQRMQTAGELLVKLKKLSRAVVRSWGIERGFMRWCSV